MLNYINKYDSEQFIEMVKQSLMNVDIEETTNSYLSKKDDINKEMQNCLIRICSCKKTLGRLFSDKMKL